VNAKQKGINLGGSLDKEGAFGEIASTTKIHRVGSTLYRWVSSTPKTKSYKSHF
jgi:hypothetical protein